MFVAAGRNAAEDAALSGGTPVLGDVHELTAKGRVYRKFGGGVRYVE